MNNFERLFPNLYIPTYFTYLDTTMASEFYMPNSNKRDYLGCIVFSILAHEFGSSSDETLVIRPSEIAEILQITPSQAGSAIKRLNNAGYINAEYKAMKAERDGITWTSHKAYHITFTNQGFVDFGIFEHFANEDKLKLLDDSKKEKLQGEVNK